MTASKLAVAGLVLAGGLLLVALMIWLRPEVELESPPSVAPLIQTLSVVREPVRFVVRGHGTVVPRTESDLVAQVAGQVVWVSPNLVSGGFFAEGETLVRIETADYEVELESARAGLARARSEYARAEKELERQRRLADQSIAAESRIDDAENAFAVAAAGLREARAKRTRAERDLARTALTAPYDGRVRDETIDVGQFVNRGAAVARLYAVDYAEVRLPIADRELSYLDLPLGFQSQQIERGPEVRLHAEFAGRKRVWSGRLVRTEGEIDPRSRTVNVVARVEDPYGREATGPVVPLSVGLFVEAEILGREVESAVVLPRVALRDEDRVLIVDAESRIRFREVEVLRVERDEIIVGEGLAIGERVCVSPLAAAIEGMTVRVQGEAPPELARSEP